jgi:hypothetical protein
LPLWPDPVQIREPSHLDPDALTATPCGIEQPVNHPVSSKTRLINRASRRHETTADDTTKAANPASSRDKRRARSVLRREIINFVRDRGQL